MRKLGNRARLEPKALANDHRSGRQVTAACPRGVLSGRVLSGGESPLHGEGPDGSTQPAKETRAGHVGLEYHEPTSLQGIAQRAKRSKTHRFQDLYHHLNAKRLHACFKELNSAAAPGIDGITVADYREELEANIECLVERLKHKRYHTKLIKRCYIPKAHGKQRPLGLPVLEDKLLQRACSQVLNAIYEADFLDFSNGYRPERSAKETVSDLVFNLQYGKYGYIVEADIQGFFDNLDHDKLLSMLEQRIDDRPFLSLIEKWLKAGILETDGAVVHPETGSPQGGVVSPILANVYLHHVLDLWFQETVKSHLQGEAMMCRYADDFVCAFQYQDDAERFFRTLPKRLANYGLAVAPAKTRLMRFSRFHPSRKSTFTFLSFEFYWTKDRQGERRLKLRTARDRLQRACRCVKEWIRDHRHLPGRRFIKALNRRLQGHYNYFGLRGNSESLYRFYKWAKDNAFKWLNRRGGKQRSFTWTAFEAAIKRLHIALPRITEVRRQHRVFA